MAVHIRVGDAEDMAAASRLVHAAGLPTEGLEGAWRMWIAEDDGQVVGTAALERHDGALLLRSVAVAAHRRGQGIGSALVRHVLGAADGTVALLTDTAGAWFAHFGFRRISRDELHPALARSVLLQTTCCESSQALIREAM